jgi:hypothetical protein
LRESVCCVAWRQTWNSVACQKTSKGVNAMIFAKRRLKFADFWEYHDIHGGRTSLDTEFHGFPVFRFSDFPAFLRKPFDALGLRSLSQNQITICFRFAFLDRFHIHMLIILESIDLFTKILRRLALVMISIISSE